MAKTITVTLLYWEYQGNKKYVSEMPKRFDGKLLPIYADKPEEAFPYTNEGHAQQCMDRFHNPNFREFKTMPYETPVSRKKLRVHEAFEDDIT